MNESTQDQTADVNYFSSPEDAVMRVTAFLRQGDFKTLATYYDLSKSEISRPHLESGSFFIQGQPPEVAHPAGFWRYKHPFPLGFEYRGKHPAGDDDV